jgi:NADH-quinone oxidoreductase subunit L
LTVPFGMLALTVFLTAFYMFRVIFLAFFGRVHGEGHAHEAPWSMLIPLWLLALMTVGVGVLFAYPGSGVELPHHGPEWLMPLSFGLAVLGILFAWVVYQQEEIKADTLAKALKPFYVAAKRNYWLDDLYAGLYRGVLLAFSTLIGWIDRYLVDGLVNVASAFTIRFGRTLRLIQSGRAQDYLYGVALGLLALIAWGYLR